MKRQAVCVMADGRILTGEFDTDDVVGHDNGSWTVTLTDPEHDPDQRAWLGTFLHAQNWRTSHEVD